MAQVETARHDGLKFRESATTRLEPAREGAASGPCLMGMASAYLAALGTELERTGKHEDARRRVTEALALIAHLPKGKDALLELLAHELSFADRKPNAEQAELLRKIRR
jgi:hypothetical protein